MFLIKPFSFTRHSMSSINSFRLWRDMYCQFHSAPLLNENIEDVITGLCQYDEALEDHCDYLQQVGIYL